MELIGKIPEIQQFKDQLEQCEAQGILTEWELPYESLLTRIQAAIFFFNLDRSVPVEDLYVRWSEYPGITIKRNETTMSAMAYQISFQ